MNQPRRTPFTHRLAAVVLSSFLLSSFAISEAVPSKKHHAKPAAHKTVNQAPPAGKAPSLPDSDFKPVDSLQLVSDANQWIGQRVRFEAEFVSFSPYALDYKPALRSSKDYIALLIRRPDVAHHTIPLSELKLIYPRKLADQVMDLESADKIMVKGKVFSAALGDPWLDIEEVKLLQKAPENLSKDKKKRKTELD